MLESLAHAESRLRPFTGFLPVRIQARIYSAGRRWFIHQLAREDPPTYTPSPDLERSLWGITHQGPLMWAAGVDKEGQLYHISSQQGAAAHMVGTTTSNPRTGNIVEGVVNPFLPFPRAHAAINNLGLPNSGDAVVADRVRTYARHLRCPVWASVMASPDLKGDERLEKLVEGMRLYASAGVTYIEVNLSCPNTGEQSSIHDFSDHDRIVRFVGERFARESPVRVGLKESADLPLEYLPRILDLAFAYGFSGINGINTSKNYPLALSYLGEKERESFAEFSRRFSGGFSGRPLKDKSLAFCSRASAYLRQGPPSQEFHVIRTGGIETAQDLIESDQTGVSMNQWVTGFWESFAQEGHGVYRRIHADYKRLRHGR